MKYTYETHLHTNQSSACGMTKGKDYIPYYQDLGYAGIMVTDHFFRGNTAVPRNLPWRERIHLFCKGYEDAREAGEKAGFSVFFGWEENHQGDEYLIYGVDKEWMLDHPEMEFWNRKQQFDAIHSAGGCVIQAHPFRDRDYLSVLHLSTGCVDAVEGYNGGNRPENDILAVRYAKILDLPVTAGSDMHQANRRPSEMMMGVTFDAPLESVADYVKAIREKRPFGVRKPEGRGQWREDADILKPVDVRDANDKSTDSDIWKLLKTGVK